MLTKIYIGLSKEQVSVLSVWGEHMSCVCVGIFHKSEGQVK